METFFSIGLDEWEKVVEIYSVDFPGQDVEYLCRKYTVIQREKVPTGDLNMPEEVRLAKKVKYLIGDTGWGGRKIQYD